jgi:myosin heavy subunit
MVREHAMRIPTARWVLVGALSLSAAAGWGSFAVSSHSATETERQLRGELGSLQEAQGKLLTERSKMRAAVSEMTQLRTDLSATRAEVARLSQLVGQAKTEPPPVSPETKESARTNPATDALTKAGSIMTKASKPLPVKVSPGDKPSAQDHEGQAAVKNAGPDRQKKLAEKPQRSATPPVRPELDTASLRQLTTSAEAQAQ